MSGSAGEARGKVPAAEDAENLVETAEDRNPRLSDFVVR